MPKLKHLICCPLILLPLALIDSAESEKTILEKIVNNVSAIASQYTGKASVMLQRNKTIAANVKAALHPPPHAQNSTTSKQITQSLERLILHF